MSLILLEGLDRTGKSTVAQYFKDNGYEVIHLSAPPKELSQPGYVGPSYLDQMVELLMSANARDTVLDRTHYGELIWPAVYGRKPHLSEADFDVLREIEESIGVKRILMHDPHIEAHWKRCVDNNEPLTKAQFIKARQLYDRMAEKYNFEKHVMGDFVDVPNQTSSNNQSTRSNGAAVSPAVQLDKDSSSAQSGSVGSLKSPEILKLEKANVINDVLSKRIIKSKGPMYDELETDVRNFLKERLGKIFGETTGDLSKDEIQVLKAFVKRIKDKENVK